MIEDKPRLLRYGQAGRALAIKRYSLDAVLHRTFAAYQELTEDV